MIDEPEKSLHKKAVKLLNFYRKTRKLLFFHVKNDVGARRGNFFYDLKHLGVMSGVSDFVILTEKNITFLELKTKKGKLSKNQKEFINDAQDLGHRCIVAYGWDEIEKYCTEIAESAEKRESAGEVTHPADETTTLPR